jgi:hypothetical protein
MHPLPTVVLPHHVIAKRAVGDHDEPSEGVPPPFPDSVR